MYKKILTIIMSLSFSALTHAARPAAYDELLDYVIKAPNQGEAGTCLFVSSTGSMEILLNKKFGLKDQRPGDRFDLSEMFLNFQKSWTKNEHRTVDQILKFNWGKAITESIWPYDFDEKQVWIKPSGFSSMPKINVPQIATVRLFVRGSDRWATNVLKLADVEKVKQALWDYRSPILINYNDEGFWHSVNIVGYDDSIDGNCYDTPQAECNKTKGAFYVRDHFGNSIDVRDADWFRAKGNAASVIKLK